MEAGKLQMDLFENEWPSVQPPIECPMPECCEVSSFTKAGTACCGQIIKCSKCHERETREQVTKLLELYAPETEAPTTAPSIENQESESLASSVKRLPREVSSMKETIDALRHENTAMKAEIRNPQGINHNTCTETPELNTADTPNEAQWPWNATCLSQSQMIQTRTNWLLAPSRFRATDQSYEPLESYPFTNSQFAKNYLQGI